MNNLLKLNKKILLLLLLLLFTIILIFLIPLIKNEQNKTELYNTEKESITYDILNPKFTINNNNQKIAIKANEGNFISNDNILLKNNVTFKSKRFLIKSSEVYFDKTKQTAFSNEDSIFFSNKATIKSKGFEIKDNGNNILFNGKSLITLSK